ncbi:MAG: thioredoxin [Bacteroidia bacterium]|nr:thioredoxin [Bacteroidia bacterium]
MSDKIVVLNAENFETEVLKSEVPVIVDFWATWCGPCRAIAPLIDDLANEYSNVKFAKVNVDENRDLSFKYKIMSIPSILIFKHGIMQEKVIGARGKEEYCKLIEKYL